jgi:hypothetical protein
MSTPSAISFIIPRHKIFGVNNIISMGLVGHMSAPAVHAGYRKPASVATLEKKWQII